MSARKKDIEKLFASEFEDYRHDFDVDGAWEAVASGLEEKKKKRRFFWWFWPVGILSVAAIAFLIINQTNNNNNLSELEIQSTNNNNNLTEVETQSTNAQRNPKQLFDDRTESMNAPPSDAVRPKAKNTLNSLAERDKTIDRSSRHQPEQRSHAAEDRNNIDKQAQSGKSDVVKSNVPIKTNQATKESIQTNVVQREISPKPPLIQERKSNERQQAKTNNTEDEAKAFEPTKAFRHLGKNLVGHDIPELYQGVDKLSLLQLQLFDIVNENTVPQKVPERNIIALREKNKRALFVELYGGGIRNFVKTDRNPSEGDPSQNYLDQWKQTQTAMGGYQIGLTVGKNIWKRFELSTGINFQKVINKIEWRENTSTTHRVVWDDDAYFSVDDQGNRSSSGGQVIETEVRYRIVKAKQTHNYVNIPIQLGYSKLLNKYSIGVRLGPVINLSHVFQGRILGGDSDIRVLTTNNYDEVYRTSVGISGLADLRIGRNIGSSMEVFTALSCHYNGNNIFKDNVALQFQNSQLKMNVGLRKQF